jgi:hypothetical protein
MDLSETVFYSCISTEVRLPTDAAGLRILCEYGAVFVASGVRTPPAVVFRNEAEVSEFQRSLDVAAFRLGGFDLELQAPAAEAILGAVDDAHRDGLSINPRGADSAGRDYVGTIELWASRIDPGLDHWVNLGRLDAEAAARIRELPPYEQVSEILALEEQGVFFAKDLSKSVLYSVAPPGTSQHLSLLAFDVREFDDPRVRRILADRFWYQTVVSDLPHFTYLGIPEEDLPGVGLKLIETLGRSFWVPDISAEDRARLA